MTTKHKQALLFCMLSAVLISVTALGQAPLKDTQARVQAAMESAAGLNSVGFTETFKATIVTGGDTDEKTLTGDIVLQGKENLSALFTMQNQKIRIVSDGKTHSLYILGDTTYQQTTEDIPRTQLLSVVTRGIFNTACTWAAGFLHNKTELLETSGPAEEKGSQNVGGTECEGYLLAYPTYDVTVWLTRSDPPALRRADFDLKKGLQKQANGPTDARVQVDIADWKPNVKIEDNQFVFSPPDGVELVRPGGSPLEGKKAPDFEVPLLDGGTLKLSSLKGKTVVIDIWATWCGPCRRAMPIVEKVAEEFADKGVELYAVNQGEAADVVKKFLQSANLHPKVALDSDGKVSRAYGADSIPRIIVVGPDGVVRRVFRGISASFEDELRTALSDASKGATPAK